MRKKVLIVLGVVIAITVFSLFIVLYITSDFRANSFSAELKKLNYRGIVYVQTVSGIEDNFISLGATSVSKTTFLNQIEIMADSGYYVLILRYQNSFYVQSNLGVISYTP